MSSSGTGQVPEPEDGPDRPPARLVVDTGVALTVAAGGLDLASLGAAGYLAPALLWSEATSALHEARWRRQVTDEQAAAARAALAALPIERDEPPDLRTVAWAVADELGWAKTYDVEFVALARIRGCRVVTTDARLRRGADRLGLVVGLTEL